MRLEELDTPALVVDLDVMQANLASLAAYCKEHHLALRPHTKTHKISEIAKMQLAAGCQGITVAKVGEAEVMANAGIDDILIAFPVLGESKLERLVQLARKNKIAVSLDSLEVASAISEAARNAGCDVHILLEFDVGMHRCGVQSVPKWVELAQAVEGLPNLSFEGLMFYPGHIWDPPDEQFPALRQLSDLIEEIRQASAMAGLELKTVSGGSTPTAYNSHLVRGLTEIRAGTYVFFDRNEWRGGFCQLSQCALRVLVTVVSEAVEGRAMIDGGSKTFSGDRLISGDRQGYGSVVEYPGIQFVSMSEEHGHLDLSQSDRRPKIGERLSVIPNHVCTCVNMHDRIYYHRNGIVEGSWVVEGRGRIR
ncbi:MAG: D-TA family PLP-dependent enzyme [Terriglobia bacterium]